MKPLRHICDYAPLYIIAICLLIVLLAGPDTTKADIKALQQENAEIRRELHNLRGTVHDQAATIRHLTDPKVMTDRIFEFYEAQWKQVGNDGH